MPINYIGLTLGKFSYCVGFTGSENEVVEKILLKGKRAVREVNRARILLLSNSGKRNDELAETLCVNRNTVLGVKKRYLKCGLAGALHDGERKTARNAFKWISVDTLAECLKIFLLICRDAKVLYPNALRFFSTSVLPVNLILICLGLTFSP